MVLDRAPTPARTAGLLFSGCPGAPCRPARSAGGPARRPGSAHSGRAARTRRRSSCRWPRWDAHHDLGDTVDQAEQAERQREGDRAGAGRTTPRRTRPAPAPPMADRRQSPEQGRNATPWPAAGSLIAVAVPAAPSSPRALSRPIRASSRRVASSATVPPKLSACAVRSWAFRHRSSLLDVGRSGPFPWTKSKPSTALVTVGSKRSASVPWGQVAHRQLQLGNCRADRAQAGPDAYRHVRQRRRRPSPAGRVPGTAPSTRCQ
jgi:hypothetical protein